MASFTGSGGWDTHLKGSLRLRPPVKDNAGCAVTASHVSTGLCERMTRALPCSGAQSTRLPGVNRHRGQEFRTLTSLDSAGSKKGLSTSHTFK